MEADGLGSFGILWEMARGSLNELQTQNRIGCADLGYIERDPVLELMAKEWKLED